MTGRPPRKGPAANEDLRSALQSAIREHGFVYGLLADPDGQILAEGGDPERLRWQGRRTRLFGTAKDIRDLNDSLDGRILPAIKAQGEVVCALARPTDRILLALFHQDGRSDPDVSKEVEQLSQELARLLA